MCSGWQYRLVTLEHTQYTTNKVKANSMHNITIHLVTPVEHKMQYSRNIEINVCYVNIKSGQPHGHLQYATRSKLEFHPQQIKWSTATAVLQDLNAQTYWNPISWEDGVRGLSFINKESSEQYCTRGKAYPLHQTFRSSTQTLLRYAKVSTELSVLCAVTIKQEHCWISPCQTLNFHFLSNSFLLFFDKMYIYFHISHKQDQKAKWVVSALWVQLNHHQQQ